MIISAFNEKLNKLNNNIYTIEEIAIPIDGVYEKELIHDNIISSTINVYTGSKLSGDRITTYITSTPSATPWKTNIKIYSTLDKLYITYETTGDQMEAEDVNNLQDAIVDTQTALNDEIDRAIARENEIANNLDSETTRAKNAESTLTNNLNTTNNNLNSEIARAKGAEGTLTTNLNTTNNNLNSEITRAKGAESTLTTNLTGEVNRATGAEGTLTTNLNAEINRAKSAESALTSTINTNKPIWDDKYTKNEVDNKISQVITNMDWKESVTTYNDLATTYPNADDGWTANTKDTDITYRYNGSAWIAISANAIPLASSSVDGKMSKQDKIDHDDMVTKRHTHPNKSILDIITQTLVDSWNSAYTHISDTIKHITSDERTLWNTVSNKVDKITGKSLSTNDFDNNYKAKIDGISSNANKVESSTINGNIKIDSVEKPVYVHPSGTNPHGTTKTDVGLGNVTNDSQVKRSEMGIASGVATLDSSGNNNQPPKTHTHDDRYYTEAEADSKFATKVEMAGAGNGDMLKSVYDTDNDGIVDKAESLQSFSTANSSGTYGGYYTKIASVSITGQYADANSIIGLTSCGSGSTVQVKGNLYFRVKQQNALGTPPYIDLKIVDTDLISEANFVAVTTVNTASVTTVELYYKAVQSYDSLSIIPIFNSGFTFYNNQSYVSALPAGTQTKCSQLPIGIAVKLASQRTLSFTGDITGSAVFDGSQNVNIITTFKTGLTWNDLQGS